MPPLIPRLRCLQRCSFSTSRTLRALGPESPQWLPVPRSIQPNLKPKPPVKGVLPVPRDPFRRDNKHAFKAGAKYLAAVTKAPSPSKPKPSGQDADRLAWKARMAAFRRKNLKEGMIELARRKIKRLDARRIRQERGEKERQARLSAPERDDEKYTRPTLSPAIRALLSQRVPSAPRRTVVQINRARVRYEAKERKKAAVRQKQVYLLNRHARSFSVDDKALDETLEKEFGTNDRPRGFGHDGRGLSVWDEGMPMGIKEMVDMTEGSMVVEHMRLKRLAEELTGGRA